MNESDAAPPTLDVPGISPTTRLVSLPPIHLRDATTGLAPRLTTAVRIGLREGAILLVRFDARDAGITATLTRRDGPLWTEDVFEVFLWPGQAPVYYEFEVNPLGALFDARIESPDLSRRTMRVDSAWRCPGFAARVTRGQDRWSALLKIPLGAMARENDGAAWRANFHRIDRGDPDEFSSWSPAFADPPDFHVPARFGALRLDPEHKGQAQADASANRASESAGRDGPGC